MTRQWKERAPLVALGLAVFSLVGLLVPPAFAQEVPKVAVIDVARLLQESSAGKTAIDDLKQWQLAKQDEGNKKGTKVADLRKQLEEGRLSLSEEKLAELQKELEAKLIEYQRFGDDANRELTRRQNNMLQEIQTQVMPVIQAVGEELGYTMIFNKYESGLVFAKDTIDITNVVLERFEVGSEDAAEAGTATESGS